MTNVFEERNTQRAVLKLRLPAMLAQLATLIYNMADTYFVSMTDDPAQIAAVTLCMPILLHGMYAYDAKTPDEYIQRIRKFTLKGIAHRITQDVLILGAREDHFIMPKLFHEEYDLLKNVRSLTLSLMTDRQDAGAHCNVGNTKLALDTMADWIIQRKREK